MKSNKIADAERHLAEKADGWPVRLSRFAFHDLIGLGSGEVTFNSPLTVITGPNSIGKTTILRAIWFALDPVSAMLSKVTLRKLQSGRVVADIFRYGQDYHIDRIVENRDDFGDVEYEVIHLDNSEVVASVQVKLCSLGDYEDIINGAPERVVEQGELERISYLTRRDYIEVKLFEVEVEAGITAPFFEVAYGSAKYDTRRMGAGEYSALYSWWAISRAPKGSFILIEEPETFLSSLSQVSLLDYIKVVTDERKLCVIITSHAGHLLHPLDESSVKFLRREGENCTFTPNAPHPTSLEAIGIYIKPDIYVYVEDKAAVLIGRMLLERFDAQFSRRCRLESVGGEAVITKSLTVASANPFGLKFVGWFDGDQQGKIPDAFKSIAALLPGDAAIEAVLRQYVVSNAVDFAAAIRRNDFAAILAGLQGLNPHDWSFRLSQALYRDHSSVLALMFEFWLGDGGNLATAKASYESFRQICG